MGIIEFQKKKRKDILGLVVFLLHNLFFFPLSYKTSRYPIHSFKKKKNMKIKNYLVIPALTLLRADAWAPTTITSSLAGRHVTSHRRQVPLSSSTSSTTRLYVGSIERSDTEDSTSASFQETDKNRILGDPIPYSELTVGVLKETFKGENRVSQVCFQVKDTKDKKNLILFYTS